MELAFFFKTHLSCEPRSIIQITFHHICCLQHKNIKYQYNFFNFPRPKIFIHIAILIASLKILFFCSFDGSRIEEVGYVIELVQSKLDYDTHYDSVVNNYIDNLKKLSTPSICKN